MEARQILRKLLVGRLVFTTKEDENGRYYEFAGKGSISEIVRGARGTVHRLLIRFEAFTLAA